MPLAFNALSAAAATKNRKHKQIKGGKPKACK
jgi:hypothetical protein